MATPTPNEWNKDTTTVYSSSGSAKEIPIARYDEFISSGWGATAPNTQPEEKPLDNQSYPIEENKQPATVIEDPIQVPPSIPAEEMPSQELDGLLAENEALASPVAGIQDVFGPDWQPAPIFEQLGLTEQGIYGAVRIKGMNDVYTIGTGGRKETAESYKERFGTSEQQGIVGEISMEEAVKLGIVVGAESIVEPISNKDPYEVWSEFRDEDKAEIDTLRTNLTKTTQNLIDKLTSYGEDKAEAKDEAKEKLGIDEKDKAISDAQKVRNDLYNSYEKLIVDLSHSTMTTSHIGGLQARARAQRAVEIAPLDSNILIAQNSYARAKDLLDDWSTDYAEAMQFKMQAAQLNISMLEGELNREQQENLTEAKIKFDIWQNEENRRLDTQEETKKLMLMYPEAGISIADNWEDAYRKISPYIQSEKDFENKMREIELATAQKALAKPYYKYSGGSTPEEPKIVEWSEVNERAGIVGWDQDTVDSIKNNPTAPDWFNEQAPERYQMSKASWQEEWEEIRNPIIEAFRKTESSGFSRQQELDLEARYGADWQTTVPREQQLNYINSLKNSSRGREF